jgi:hypothetical protein
VCVSGDGRLFRSAIDQARTRDVSGLVFAEVDYFLITSGERCSWLFRISLAAPSPTRHRLSVSSPAQSKWIKPSRIFASASSTVRWWH